MNCKPDGADVSRHITRPDNTSASLINGKQFLMEYCIGVHRSAPDLFENDEEFGPVIK